MDVVFGMVALITFAGFCGGLAFGAKSESNAGCLTSAMGGAIVGFLAGCVLAAMAGGV